ncbi:MAG: hypothetical protein ACT4N8_12330 [Sphingosinicella sp.]|uniref:hypothetical protein n=1 Tax=Sphingosinicella sp. TaxID=1917971 RepID=UPI004037F126
MSRIGALRLAFIGLAIFASVGLMRDWIAQWASPGFDYRLVGLVQSFGFLTSCYGFYRFLLLGERQKQNPVDKSE